MKLTKEKVKEVEVKKVLSELVEIVPLRNFHIAQNEINIVIQEGVPVSIPRRFLQNMLTEQIISKLPTEG